MLSVAPTTPDLKLSYQQKFTELIQSALLDVFVKGNISQFANTKKNPCINKYTELTKFILLWRNKSGVKISPNDSLLPMWLFNVAPSCCYKLRKQQVELHFMCVFCMAPMSSQFAIIRHYREQHYAWIPKDIFGNIIYIT